MSSAEDMEGVAESIVEDVVENSEHQQVDKDSGFKALPRERKDKTAWKADRQPGTPSHFPFAKIQRLLKADKELPIVQREAAWLVAVATEEFVRRMGSAAQRIAAREGRSTVQLRDHLMLARKADEYAFLEEILAYVEDTMAGERKGRDVDKEKKAAKGKARANESAQGLLDKFVANSKNANSERDQSEELSARVVMNEDGTMSVDPS